MQRNGIGKTFSSSVGNDEDYCRRSPKTPDSLDPILQAASFLDADDAQSDPPRDSELDLDLLGDRDGGPQQELDFVGHEVDRELCGEGKSSPIVGSDTSNGSRSYEKLTFSEETTGVDGGGGVVSEKDDARVIGGDRPTKPLIEQSISAAPTKSFDELNAEFLGRLGQQGSSDPNQLLTHVGMRCLLPSTTNVM